MKALILGANGFVGSHLAEKLAREGNAVSAAYNTKSSQIPSGCKKIPVAELYGLTEFFDHVYICVGNFSCTHEEFVSQAIEIYHIIKQLRYDRVVFVSSIAVYGNHAGIISYQSEFVTPSLYGQYKLACEFLLTSLPNCSIVRFTYLYGPGMSENSLIPRWINTAKTNGVIAVYGDGARAQDYLYIDDAISLIIKTASEKILPPFIAASGVSISNRDLAYLLAELIPGTKIKFTGSDSSASFFFDISFTKKELQWMPTVDLRTGLTRLLTTCE